MTSKEGHDHQHSQIQKKLENLKIEEVALQQEIQNFLKQKSYLDGKVKGLSRMLPQIKLIRQDAEGLVNSINHISESSENISGKIKVLDRAKSRVEEVQKRVSDLIDLEMCSDGVQKAILDEDYEKGAALIHRFLSIDQSLLKRTASDVEKVSGVLKSVRTLQDAASQLQAIIKHKFDDAVKSNDLHSIERFFKIFPLIGMHDEGIRDFCEYLSSKLEETAQKNLTTALNTPIADKRYNIIYADTLTLLYEGIARMINVHQPLIETYYGPGKLLSAVKILQKECDKQTKRIVGEFLKNRNVNKRISQITEISRMSSSSSFSKLEKIDPKDLDILIAEITIMHSRAELYINFIKGKVTNDIEVGITEIEDRVKQFDVLESLVKNSQLAQSKHELLGFYLRLEQYFMEESINKAVSLDSVDQGQYVSSMVDDTFFIIKKCIRRATSTGSLDGICAIINNACRVLESDYCSILRSKLKQGYPSGYLDLTQAYNVLQTSIQQGRLQPGDTEVARTAFIVALNNADTSNEYVDTLCDRVLLEIVQAMPSMKENDRGKLESCLSGLSSVTTALKEVIDYGLQQLRSSAIKPRVTSWIDGFINVNHQLSEEELSAYEAGETFIQTLIMNLETLLLPFKEVLTPSNYDSLITVVTTEITLRFEKVILKSSFNRLGGLVLDKEVRSLSGYLTASTSWSVRDKFARLTQIATVLNLEKVSEISDYWGDHDGALTWRLTPSELRSVMALRSDFKIEDIRRLKL
ncbi:conserved oligomeric Golgi complex subunit 4 [Onthophagus taurus]|uniref:conserved oligomeric Golgi complex subunit 4 n=1 Tax=Onthophagus taurus TaxID=166361 RepID=UPI000C20A068|nr:conserved oligomeric Golgi complex subunit 4 [Onthophagus taurus]